MSDSDLGGDPPTKRSTSGGVGLLLGDKSRALVHAYSKRQGAVGASTPDAELIAQVVLAKRSILLHMIQQRLMKRTIPLVYRGDNSACERVCNTGISATLGYMKRTAEISLRWCQMYE